MIDQIDQGADRRSAGHVATTKHSGSRGAATPRVRPPPSHRVHWDLAGQARPVKPTETTQAHHVGSGTVALGSPLARSRCQMSQMQTDNGFSPVHMQHNPVPARVAGASLTAMAMKTDPGTGAEIG